MEKTAGNLNDAVARPKRIEYKRDGKFFKVMNRSWK
jgi:hypothetical protein